MTCLKASGIQFSSHNFARREQVPPSSFSGVSPPPIKTWAPDSANKVLRATCANPSEGGGRDGGGSDMVFSTTSQVPSNRTPFHQRCRGTPSLPPALFTLTQPADRLSGAIVRTDPKNGRRFSSQGWREQFTVQGRRPEHEHCFIGVGGDRSGLGRQLTIPRHASFMSNQRFQLPKAEPVERYSVYERSVGGVALEETVHLDRLRSGNQG